jgi:hypothetical protein
MVLRHQACSMQIGSYANPVTETKTTRGRVTDDTLIIILRKEKRLFVVINTMIRTILLLSNENINLDRIASWWLD